MKNFFCALLLMTAVFGGGKMQAQYTNNYWLFGDSAGINWSNPANPILFGNAAYCQETKGVQP
ncbi:MAG: hypothetical protein IPM91_20125 [Bacteroidetes bacterium]|nr:hypothetical protein [Bacteroidota bacterium]